MSSRTGPPPPAGLLVCLAAPGCSVDRWGCCCGGCAVVVAGGSCSRKLGWWWPPKTGLVVSAENWAGGVVTPRSGTADNLSKDHVSRVKKSKMQAQKTWTQGDCNIAPSQGQANELNKQKVCKTEAVNQSQSADRLEATSPVIGRGPAVHPDVRTSLCRRVLQQSPSARDSTMA